jgi:NTP pyrophosphatase (non-canonical NTP hydrolase)
MTTKDRHAALLEDIRAFVHERNWEQFHDPKNLAMAVASEAGELVAELRWVPSHEADEWCKDEENRARVSREIADVAITLFMLADRLGIDLAEAMHDKLQKNREKYPVDRWKGERE